MIKNNNMIIRLLKAITSIPLPQTGIGSKTQSMKGMVDYQNDMREARPYLYHIIQALIFNESINEDDIIAVEKIAGRSQNEN